MRPTRRAAAVAAAAVARPMSPSPISSEEDEMMDSSELEDMEAGEQDEIFSEEDEMDQEDNDMNQPTPLDSFDMESLSEQEEELEDEEEPEEQPEEDAEEDNDQVEEDDEDDEEEQMPVPPRKSIARMNNSKRKKPAIEPDSDEEEVFSDDSEVLRNKPMTKRQRAKVYQEIPEEYLELPMDSGKKKQLTREEEQLKKSEVARRRKNQSIQRAEKDKADTINRLLKKQASKSKRIIDDTEDKETPHEKLMRQEDPNRIRYVNTAKGSELNIPSVYTIEQLFGNPMHHSFPKPVQKCQVSGCSENRKYTAKKSGKFVCSLEHYKIVEAK